MNTLLNKFIEYIHSEKLIQSDDSILVGVSGGIDSVVLLHLLVQYSKNNSIDLAVIHVNHLLRNLDSDLDEKFVQQLSTDYGLPNYSESIDIAKKSENDSLENIARILRYQIFDKYLKRLEYKKLALGHHADDQAETVLMHLFQGAGVRGLRGMLPMRDQIIRPLLFAAKFEIEEYANEFQLKYRTDSTNTDTKFLRNNIRHTIIPNLNKQLDINIVKGVQRSANILREVEIFIAHEINNAYRTCVHLIRPKEIVLDIPAFLKYFFVIQSGLLIRLIEEMRGLSYPVRNYEIDELLRLIQNHKSGMQTELNGPIFVAITGEKMVFHQYQDKPFSYNIDFDTENELPCCQAKLLIQKLFVEQIDPNDRTNKDVEYIDLDKIQYPVKIRNKKESDLFYPLGMNQTKKLQDFFVDEKIENYKRNQMPILVDNKDRILWICSHRIDNRFKISDSTRNVLKLEIIYNT